MMHVLMDDRWSELLIVVGPFGDHASWPLAGDKVVLVPEVSGRVTVDSWWLDP